MFESKNWFKEFVVVIALALTLLYTLGFISPFPYSIPIAMGVLTLIIWLIHKKSISARGNTSGNDPLLTR